MDTIIATVLIAFLVAPDVDTGGVASAETLVDSVLEQPGSWNQMCSMFPPVYPGLVPLFDFGLPEMHYWISPESFHRLRAQRSAVLEVLKQRIPATTDTVVDVLKELDNVRRSPDGSIYYVSGVVEDEELSSYLSMALDLNGVEILSELLELERALDNLGRYDFPVPQRETLSTFAEFRGENPHARLLATILGILLQEQWKGVLESEMYAIFQRDYRVLRAITKADRGDRFQPDRFPDTLDPAAPFTRMVAGGPPVFLEGYRHAPKFDEILSAESVPEDDNRPLFRIPLTKENRDDIVAMAEAFMKETPQEQYKAAAGMAETPIKR